MRAAKLLHKLLSKSCDFMHSKRFSTLVDATVSLLSCRKLTLTSLGRFLKRKSKVKHQIRCIDRLLGNIHLHSERENIYRVSSQLLLGQNKRPTLIVDWSALPDKNYQLLRASIASKGRAIVIYEEVHPIKKLGNGEVQKLFLKKLKQIIPPDCQPIIVTDAGFRSNWFKDVKSLGWDFIGRIRHQTAYKLINNGCWGYCYDLYPKSTAIPKFIGSVLLSKSTPISCELFILKTKAKGRTAKNKDGARKCSTVSTRNGKAQRDPWLLATSLTGGERSAKKVMKIFSWRMQIEQNFRDLKSTRHGFCLREMRCYSIQRIQILLLIAMLGMLVLWLIGLAAKLKNIHYDFQCNTLKNRSVLSVIFVGWQVIMLNIQFTNRQIAEALSVLHAHLNDPE